MKPKTIQDLDGVLQQGVCATQVKCKLKNKKIYERYIETEKRYGFNSCLLVNMQ